MSIPPLPAGFIVDSEGTATQLFLEVPVPRSTPQVPLVHRAGFIVAPDGTAEERIVRFSI